MSLLKCLRLRHTTPFTTPLGMLAWPAGAVCLTEKIICLIGLTTAKSRSQHTQHGMAATALQCALRLFASGRFFASGVGAIGLVSWGTARAVAAEGDRKASDLGKARRPGVLSAIGNTPLIELRSLSAATGCRVLAKCEHLNPGGSVKDRAALWMIEAAEESGAIRPSDGDNVVVCEGTGGNTGVGLALVCAAKGYRSIMAMPASIAREKIEAMQTFGAEILPCPSVPFTDNRHYYHTARRAAEAHPGGVFLNQFENEANFRSHLEGTAPEIWAQAGGRVDGFVCAAGTGGTISGVSQFLKAVNPSVAVFLIDPPGSGLRDFVRGAPAREEKVEGDRVRFIQRSPGSSVTEGIGIGRVTANFARAVVDGAFEGSDEEALQMGYHLKEADGVYVGPSAALNAVGAVKLARKLGPGHTIVTVLCDSGTRYKSKMYNKDWLQAKGFAQDQFQYDPSDSVLSWVK